jgi:uncharacterized protein (TIGR02246 family)
MNSVQLVFLSVLAFAVGAPPRFSSTAAEREIRALLEAQTEAWNRGDLEAFMETYWDSPHTAYLGSRGVIRGWQEVLDRYRRTYPDRNAMGKTTFSDLEITMLSPESALVVGRWQLEREDDRPGGVFTLVVRKFPEGWRIIHDHTSVVTPDAPQ